MTFINTTMSRYLVWFEEVQVFPFNDCFNEEGAFSMSCLLGLPSYTIDYIESLFFS